MCVRTSQLRDSAINIIAFLWSTKITQSFRLSTNGIILLPHFMQAGRWCVRLHVLCPPSYDWIIPAMRLPVTSRFSEIWVLPPMYLGRNSDCLACKQMPSLLSRLPRRLQMTAGGVGRCWWLRAKHNTQHPNKKWRRKNLTPGIGEVLFYLTLPQTNLVSPPTADGIQPAEKWQWLRDTETPAHTHDQKPWCNITKSCVQGAK